MNDFMVVSGAVLDVLAGAKLTTGMSTAELQRLVPALRPQLRQLTDGQTLCRSGDPADRMWVITAGHILVSEIAGGSEKIVARREPGAVVGELGIMLPNGRRSATMKACGRTSVMETRVCRAVAIGKLIIDVLNRTGDQDEHIPDAIARIGIDTGRALAVNNGRRGSKEPLFLGRPANKAAKRAAGGNASGIFLTNEARKVIGLATVPEADLDRTPLTTDEIASCQENAALSVTPDQIVGQWADDMAANPIGKFEFSRHTPPLKDMPIDELAPANSRRQETISIYADLDGFTRYVDRHIDDTPEDVIKALHVIRAEMDSVLWSDFEGLKIRFIGDCIHGLLAEGTVYTTDEEVTITTAVICAGAIRSSFLLSLEKLDDAGIDIKGLGLAIGLEYGPMAVTRLGMKGDLVRCSVSRGILASENEQCRCNGTETALGPISYGLATLGVQKVFGAGRKAADLDYDKAVTKLSLDDDDTAKRIAAASYQIVAPAVAKAVTEPFRPHCK